MAVEEKKEESIGNSNKVKKGNIVLFDGPSGQDIKIDGEDCLLLREGAIFAIIKE